ncbi:MAG: FixH family protein [Gammaproteobacteria bacterium]|nr:FixH family protein [Gammaproteobacteria bacterium]MCP5459515.1 FixH family protein [Gammaproteobacteria bacterium]
MATDNLLISLAIGVVLIVVGNLSLARWNHLGVVRSAMLVALVVVGGYLLLALRQPPGIDVLAIHLAIYLLTSYGCGLFLNQRAVSKEQGATRRWHWAPALIVGFFLVLVAVDTVFIVLAERGLSPDLSMDMHMEKNRKPVTSAFPGVVSHDFHKQEELFNVYLDQFHRQQKRGWQIQKGWLYRPVLGQVATFQVIARTQAGQRIAGAVVDGKFLRPADSRLDTAFTLHESEPGVYLGDLRLPAAGRWDLVLEVRKDGEVHEIRASTSVAMP